jgi:hypothetical protein
LAESDVDFVPTVILIQDSKYLDSHIFQHFADHGGLVHFETVPGNVLNLDFIHEVSSVFHSVLDVIDFLPFESDLLGSNFDFNAIGFTDFVELFLVKLLVNDTLFKPDFYPLVSELCWNLFFSDRQVEFSHVGILLTGVLVECILIFRCRI